MTTNLVDVKPICALHRMTTNLGRTMQDNSLQLRQTTGQIYSRPTSNRLSIKNYFFFLGTKVLSEALVSCLYVSISIVFTRLKWDSANT